MEEILKFVTEYGIFAGLFIWLLISTIKHNDKRETILNETINKLSDNACLTIQKVDGKVDNLKDDVHALDKKVDKIDTKVENVQHDVNYLKEKVG
jgi:peptidoglycan hydrolase CwlO-like protein